MTVQTLHPMMDDVEAITMLQRAGHGDALEVTGLVTMRDVHMVQAWADAAETCVWWSHNRVGSAAVVLVDRGEQ